MEHIRYGNNPRDPELRAAERELERAHEAQVWSGFDLDAYEDPDDYDSEEYKRLDEEAERLQELEDEFCVHRYFDVISQGPYHLEVEQVSIENVGEVFFDTDDMIEMGVWNEAGLYIDKFKMGKVLGEQISTIPAGKVSAPIEDLHLLDIMKENQISPGDLGHHNYRRRANRICKTYIKPAPPPPPPQDKPTHNDWHTLAHMASAACVDKHNMRIETVGDDEDWSEDDWKDNRLKALTAMKKLVLWREMLAVMNEREYSKPKQKWVKQIWGNAEYHFDNM